MRTTTVVALAIGAASLGGVVWFLAASTRGVDDAESRRRYYDGMNAARGFVERRDTPSALAALDRSKKLDPSNPDAYRMKAALLANSQRYTEARAELLQAHKLLPNDPEILLTLLEYTPPYLPAADTEALARDAIRLAPQDPRGYRFLAGAIENSHDPKRLNEAIIALASADKLAPNQPDNLVTLGRLHLRTGDTGRAEAILEAAWAITNLAKQNRSVPPSELLKMRRNVSFWLAEAYTQNGKKTDASRMRTLLDRTGSLLRELDTARMRVSTNPPDPRSAVFLRSYESGAVAIP